MTGLRPTSTPTWTIAAVTDRHRREFERLVAQEPFVNAVIASRLAAFRTLEPARFGGPIVGVHNPALTAAAFNGGNLLPVAGSESSWTALANHIAHSPRACTSIVGRADAVATMWPILESSWGRARAIRTNQPLLAIGRGELRIAADARVRAMRPADLERYLPAAAAMFTEELGISPFASTSYRRRVESLLATGRAFGIVDDDGRMAFKADVGALSATTCQLQGVWVRPDLRGRGLGTAALAAVLQTVMRLAPTASLYVNDFNEAARRMYAKLGMRQVASLATVLF